MSPARENSPRSLAGLVPLIALGVIASALLFWNLGARYLWQDEAACAVLAERLFEHGRPLGYDGRNLITMDEFRAEEAADVQERDSDAETAVRFFVGKGDFKDDTTWIGQPWGQFVAAGSSMALFGKGTFQARLPFALAAVLTVLVLFQLVRGRFDDPMMAWIAAALLLGNVFWFLHARQCRYYSTATLFSLLTLASYLRWQDGARWGATGFVACGWLWFQNDFGSPWPVYGILFADALLREPRQWLKPTRMFAALGAAIAPFVLFYELHTRVKESFVPWSEKFTGLLFNVNQYQLPLLLLPVIAWLWWRDRGRDERGRRVVALCATIVVAQLFWMPTVGPLQFYRYVVDLSPLSALLVAYFCVRIVRRADAGGATWKSLASAGLALALLVSPVVSLPVSKAVRPDSFAGIQLGGALRPELKAYGLEISGSAPDPNRAVAEWLKERLQPGDEVLVNYEDCPLMFYLDNPIRGGISAFRVRDPNPPPRFAVMRRSVPFVHWPVFNAVMNAALWKRYDVVGAPDLIWGNNPDPAMHYYQIEGFDRAAPIQVYEWGGLK